MDDCTRVLLYGTFDGFTYSTDDLPRITVVLDGGERVEIPKEFVVSADQMVNKNKIKLKDVIARIKTFDVESREAWLNEILNELGSDYGALKYKAGYEQGKFDGTMKREKVTVPQFVANWYEQHKYNFEFNVWDYVYMFDKKEESYFTKWLTDSSIDSFQTLVNMHQFGYEVEEEKRYTVMLKGITDGDRYLKRVANRWIISGSDEHKYMHIHTTHTRKELEEAGFGEVFNSPLFEVEEVEE